MKVGKTSVVSAGTSFNRYIGVAPIKILAVNPNKSQLEKIYGNELEAEPSYIGETTINDVKYSQVRIDFIAQMVPFTSNGVEVEYNDIIKLSFFLTRKIRTSATGKVQVCNVYGETTWITKEELDAKTCSISWFDTTGMRAMLQGEEELLGFIKTYLNVPSKSFKDRAGNIKVIPNLEEAYCQFENLAEVFKGNFKEFKDVIEMLPEAVIKVALGVKSSPEGKSYQDFYNKKFLKNNATDYGYLKKIVEESKANGAYPNTEFLFTDVQVYNVQATDLSSLAPTNTSVSPFSTGEKVDDLPF